MATTSSISLRSAGRFILHLPRLLLIGLVRVYQLVISPWLGTHCRFYPTCSQYTIQALRQYGAIKGTILAVWRILRCHPWTKGGVDPPRWFTEKRPDEAVHDAACDHAHADELHRA